MGRTSKFTFPLPGRRHKPPPAPEPTISGPMSKAQKILGSAEINVDGRRYHHRWDNASAASAISITVSETTASRLGVLDQGPPLPRSRPRPEEEEEEEESAIVPAHLMMSGAVGAPRRDDEDARGHAADAGGDSDEAEKENRNGGVSWSSSSRRLRAHHSSSTLASWYDKSKQPLSISQQTSSSAMAKGLPAKASSLLDMDGTLSFTGQKARKKPSRLDLSYLLHVRRGRSAASSLAASPSPSPASRSGSASPMATPPPILQRSLRSLSRRATKERINELAVSSAAAAAAASSRPATSASNRRGAGRVSGLQNLYEHYEQMSFRQVLDQHLDEEDDDDDEEEAERECDVEEVVALATAAPDAHAARKEAPLPPLPTSPASTTQPQPVVVISPAMREQEGLRDEEIFFKPEGPARIVDRALDRSPERTPERAAGRTPFHGHGLVTPPPADYAADQLDVTADYAASVSSRHTRTSRASRRTANSILGAADLQQNSVLSLSSDSEEDDDDLYDDLAAASRRRSPSEEAAPSAEEHQHPGAAGPPRPAERSPVKSGKRATFAPEHTYRTIPDGSPVVVVKPPAPTPNPRTSSLSGATLLLGGNGGGGQSAAAAIMRSSSRLSVMSSSTSTSTTATAWKDRPGFGIHEARPVVILPRSAYQPPEQVLHSPPGSRRLAAAARVVSARSASSAQDQPTPPMSPALADGASSGNGNHYNPRFMAVTRQEELLLGALRMKRAHMRESIISDLEDELREQHQHQQHGGSFSYPQQQLRTRSSHSTFGGRSNHGDSASAHYQPYQHNRTSSLHSSSSASHSTVTGETAGVRGRSTFLDGGHGESVAPPESVSVAAAAAGHAGHAGGQAPSSPSSPPPSSRILAGQHLLGSPFAARDLSPLEGRQERVPLYLDEHLPRGSSRHGTRPSAHGYGHSLVNVIMNSRADEGDGYDDDDNGEPSPDLSDFMDFDGSTSEDDEPLPKDHDQCGFQGSGGAAAAGLNRNDLVSERTSSRVVADPSSDPGCASHSAAEATEGSAELKAKRLSVEAVRVVDGSDGGVVEPHDNADHDDQDHDDVPQPDSPGSADGALVLSAATKKKAARLSAVGPMGLEAGWWGDDG